MKLEAKQRLVQSAITQDELREAALRASGDAAAHYRSRIRSETIDDATNQGNTGFVPSVDNERLLEEGQDELLGLVGDGSEIDNDSPLPATGMGAASRLLSDKPIPPGLFWPESQSF